MTIPTTPTTTTGSQVRDLLPFGQRYPLRASNSISVKTVHIPPRWWLPGNRLSPWLNVADRHVVPMNSIQLAPPILSLIGTAPPWQKWYRGQNVLQTTCLTSRWARTAVDGKGRKLTNATKLSQREENVPSGREGEIIGARMSHPANALDKSNLPPQVRASHHPVLKPIAPLSSSVREPLPPISPSTKRPDTSPKPPDNPYPGNALRPATGYCTTTTTTTPPICLV